MLASVLSIFLSAAAFQAPPVEPADPADPVAVEVQVDATAETAAEPQQVQPPVAPAIEPVVEANTAGVVEEEEEAEQKICKRRIVDSGFGMSKSIKVCRTRDQWEAERRRR